MSQGDSYIPAWAASAREAMFLVRANWGEEVGLRNARAHAFEAGNYLSVVAGRALASEVMYGLGDHFATGMVKLPPITDPATRPEEPSDELIGRVWDECKRDLDAGWRKKLDAREWMAKIERTAWIIGTGVAFVLGCAVERVFA